MTVNEPLSSADNNANIMSSDEERALVNRAQQGDSTAFSHLVHRYRSRVRNLIRKMVGHPDDTDDIYQEALLSASRSISRFRGESQFATWLCRIAINKSNDYLREKQSWRTRAQVIYGNACYDDEDLGAEVINAMASPAFAYDAHEHIAYCWSCVARSLPADQNASLVYREFMGFTNRESAREMNMSESVFRHTLSAARANMREKFDDLCALVSKQGVCYQCVGLRDGCPTEKRGCAVPALPDMETRVNIVKDAELDSGKSQSMHDLFYRRTATLEESGHGCADEVSKCYIAGDSDEC